jgi:SagB-type dehydrogenase family enzyme
VIGKKDPTVPSPTVLDLSGGVFHERVSARHFTDDIVPIEVALKILNSAYGFQNNGHRTVPSAGNYYPLTLHLCQLRGGEIGGVYTYDSQNGRLDSTHEVGLAIQDGLQVHHVDFSNASWFILWSCRLIGPASKYGARAYRFICFEIGHSAQMAILECRSQGTDSISLGGIDEVWSAGTSSGQGGDFSLNTACSFRRTNEPRLL